MEIITKKYLVENIADSWRQSYPDNYKLSAGESSNDIWEKLKEAKTESEITSIIGNSTWTDNHCMECDDDSGVLAVFSGYDDSDIRLCENCLKQALERLQSEKENL